MLLLSVVAFVVSVCRVGAGAFVNTDDSREFVSTEAIDLTRNDQVAATQPSLYQTHLLYHSQPLLVNVSDSSRNCDAQITLDALNPWAVITSPNYPDHLPNNVRCTTIINVPSDDYQFELLFTDFELRGDETASGDDR